MDRWSPAQLIALVILLGRATFAWSFGLGDGAWIDEVISLETAALPWDASGATSPASTALLMRNEPNKHSV